MPSDALKKLLMLPGYVHVSLLTAAETIRHGIRKRVGDSSKRPQCCALRPSEYPRNFKVEAIEELRAILQRTSTVQLGFAPFFGCTICGQEWYEDFIPEKFGGAVVVRKAI